MARSSYPEPVVPGTFSSWVTKESTTEQVHDWRTGQTRRRLLGRAGSCRRGAVRQTVPARRPGQDLEGAIRRRYAAGLPFDLQIKQLVNPWQSAGLSKWADLFASQSLCPLRRQRHTQRCSQGRFPIK